MYKLKEKYKTKYYSVADINQLPAEALNKIKKCIPEFLDKYFIEE
tara:strand:+ start:3520 stop:3654 length:135 start_codon:yes stop_codon:yes gene_type:complete